MSNLVRHLASCHCGGVRLAVRAPGALEVYECNCSICSRSGFLHLIVPAEHFELSQGADCLETYTFNTGTAKHHFCRYCGIKAFYVPRSHPDGYSVNARCLDPGTVESMRIRKLDGANWEDQFPMVNGPQTLPSL